MIRARCRHCGERFEAQRRSARYCRPAHRVAAHWRRTNGKPNANHLTIGTGDNEWYTPSEYVEAARTVLGEIDLDPASNDYAQQTVRAASYYTMADDGLTKPWHGRIFLNPPYARRLIGKFIEKLREEIKVGHVTAAILLVYSYTDTRWYHAAAELASAVCYTRGRIKFVKGDGIRASPVKGSSFLYFGPNVPRFKNVFGKYGACCQPH